MECYIGRVLCTCNVVLHVFLTADNIGLYLNPSFSLGDRQWWPPYFCEVALLLFTLLIKVVRPS
jgi:hypothetical protein